MAAGRVGGQGQEVIGGQSAEAAQQDGALFKPGQSLDQPGTMVTDGGKWDLGKKMDEKQKLPLLFHINTFQHTFSFQQWNAEV